MIRRKREERRRINTLRNTLYPWLKIDPQAEVPRPGLILALILCLGLFMRLLNVATTAAIDLDGTIYAGMGEAFSHGALREGLKGIFPPFYPLLIGLAHLVIPDLETAGVAVSLVAGLVLICLCFFFFRSLLGEAGALYAAFLVAVNPYLVKYSASVLSESVACVLVFIAVLTFYKGWTGDNKKCMLISGMVLSLTYLTRPEYVVYMAPLTGLLLIKRRFSLIFFFLLTFALAAIAYIYWMKMETGLLVLSKKAIIARSADTSGTYYHSYLLPIVSLKNLAKHIPTVLYDLANALLPPMALLAVLGILRTDKRYVVLMALLTALHLMVVAAVNASSKRLYVELIPLLLPLVVGGLFSFKAFAERFRTGKQVFYVAIAALVCLLLFMGINLPDKGRGYNKQAGLYLRTHDPHRIVASRLPLVSFYSGGTWQYLPTLAKKEDTCPVFMSRMRDMGVGYAVIDEKVEAENPFISKCLEPATPVREYGNKEEFVRIYRLTPGP